MQAQILTNQIREDTARSVKSVPKSSLEAVCKTLTYAQGSPEDATVQGTPWIEWTAPGKHAYLSCCGGHAGALGINVLWRFDWGITVRPVYSIWNGHICFLIGVDKAVWPVTRQNRNMKHVYKVYHTTIPTIPFFLWTFPLLITVITVRDLWWACSGAWSTKFSTMMEAPGRRLWDPDVGAQSSTMWALWRNEKARWILADRGSGESKWLNFMWNQSIFKWLLLLNHVNMFFILNVDTLQVKSFSTQVKARSCPLLHGDSGKPTRTAWKK